MRRGYVQNSKRTTQYFTRYRRNGLAGRNTAIGPILTPPTTSLWGWWNAENCYDASPGGNLITSDGTSVVRLVDLSGNSRDLVQSTAGYRGTYETNEINASLPCLRLTADNSRWYATSAVPSQPCTIYVVFRPTTWTQYRMSTNMDGAYYAAYGWEQEVSTPKVQCRYNGGTIGTEDATLNTWHCGVQVANGSSSLIKLNNQADRTGNFPSASYLYLRLGYGGTYSMQQDVAAILLYSVAHATGSGDGLSVRQYLNSYYGLGLGI